MLTPAEFADAYDQHVAGVVRTAHAVLRDHGLAEEVAHDVFLGLWRDDRFDPARGDLEPFLRRLARNRAVDVWRRRRTSAQVMSRMEHLAMVAHRAGATDDPHARCTRAADERVTRAAVRGLPADQRDAIALTYWGEMTVAEAATTLEIPLGTAKSRVRLALRKLSADATLGAAA